jgi:Rrf2 family iron-sulfur cluster assembly transcriptional regulator
MKDKIMRLTTKGRYAVTAMLDLAVHATESPITLADISQRQGISLSYLEQLFAKLRKRELVSSARGPGGGYRLSRIADEINVADIVSAVDEKVDATRCSKEGDCQDGQPCLTHQLWMDLSDQIFSFLQNISLGQLVQQRHVKDVAARQDSYANEKLAQNDSEKSREEQVVLQPERKTFSSSF